MISRTMGLKNEEIYDKDRTVCLNRGDDVGHSVWIE